MREKNHSLLSDNKTAFLMTVHMTIEPILLREGAFAYHDRGRVGLQSDFCPAYEGPLTETERQPDISYQIKMKKKSNLNERKQQTTHCSSSWCCTLLSVRIFVSQYLQSSIL